MIFYPNIGTLTAMAPDRHWSQSQILAEVGRRVHRYRSSGVERGDRVMVHFNNTPEIFAEILAVWHLGGCVVPIDSRLTSFEMGRIAEAIGAKVSIVNDELDPSKVVAACGTKVLHTAEDLPGESERGPVPGNLQLDDDALILFTSGTTGEPKGVVHTHRSLQARWAALRQSLGTEPYKRTLCLLPTHFGHGLICNCLFPLLSGCDLVIAPPFRVDILARLGAIIDQYEITALSSVPSMWGVALRLAKSPAKGSLQQVQIGSAPLSADIWRQVIEWSGTPNVINSYGITETGSWVAGTTGDGMEPEDGLIGRPWGATAQVLRARSIAELEQGAEHCSEDEPGMIWLNTPALMKGYFQRNDLTRSVVYQGWFMTGDIGVIDSRGRLILRGRERDEINKGGMKVYPSDVEAVAQRFQAVTDVCAFAIEDDRYGQNVAIAIVLEDRNPETINELHEWLSIHLSEHKRPLRWYLLDEIRRTSRGKINRDEVSQFCSTQEPINLRQVLQSNDSAR